MGRCSVRFLSLTHSGPEERVSPVVVFFVRHASGEASARKAAAAGQTLFFEAFAESELGAAKRPMGEARLSLGRLVRGSETLATLMLDAHTACTVLVTPLDFGVEEGPEPQPLQAGALVHVAVLEARDLLPHDWDRQNDCYCIVRHAQQAHETDRVDDSNAPRWSEEDCCFCVDTSCPTLTVELWDHDSASKDDLVGVVTIELDNVCAGAAQPSGRWFPLSHRSLLRKGGRRSKGFVRLSITIGPPGLQSRAVPFQLQPFDIMVSDSPTAIGNFISAGTLSRWDHAGMVVVRDGKLFLLEATGAGVRLWPMDERLDHHFFNCQSYVGFRKIHGLGRTPELLAKLDAFIDMHLGKDYESDLFQLAKSAFAGNSEVNLDTIFCSELVAAALQHCGILAKDVISNNYSPKSFDKDVELLQGTLGKVKCVGRLAWERLNGGKTHT